jgi:hypothetical protein
MTPSNAERLAQPFAGWGKDKPANMRDLLHPDCELVVPDSIHGSLWTRCGPEAAGQALPLGSHTERAAEQPVRALSTARGAANAAPL